MNSFQNRQGENLNKKVFQVNEVQRDGTGEIVQIKGNLYRDDSEGLYNEEISLAYFINMKNPELEADSRVDDGDLIHIGNLEFKIISTPGHTKGGISLYCEKERLVFSGDTMFSGTWGRTDLPTGSGGTIIRSILDKLLVLDGSMEVFPGHGDTTTIDEEKKWYRRDISGNIN